ncbi:MAG: proline--tRNA ligase [Sulfolobales archaeon]
MAEKPSTKYGEEFSKWYDWVLDAAEIYDYGRYPVKGMGIWRPYGFKIRELVLQRLRELLNETGHEEVLFPLLITEDMIKKESEHIKGFENQVYWVTHGGLEPLDVKLALRPTSEIPITYMEALWYHSYRDLPKKLYQIVSMFRYETKSTKALIRVREVTTFKEAHTLHESFEDADKQVAEAVEIYSKFFDDLGIPYIVSKRPEWDKFPGAVYTVAFDTLMPDGRALQIGTVHHLGQTFTRIFEVRIHLRDGSMDYGWQTSYGVSERVVSALIGIHGDERGLVLLPKYAPIQVVIVPIPSTVSSEETDRVWSYAREIETLLKNAGFRVYCDLDRELKPVDKFYKYEIKGVPIRIEVGPRELTSDTVTVFRRDLIKRETVRKSELISRIKDLYREIEENLRNRAWNEFRKKIRRVRSLEEADEIFKKENVIVEIPWCGSKTCGIKLSERWVGVDLLGSPLEPVDVKDLKCSVCGKPAKTFARLARKY